MSPFCYLGDVNQQDRCSGMIEFFAQLDEYLIQGIAYLGIWAYFILLLVVFCESGLVPLIFLPGDGFIFSIGVITWRGGLVFWPIYIGLVLATLLGYQFNFWMGRYFGKKLLQPGRFRWVKRENLNRTEIFFSRYGRRAIFIGRFVPLVRTLMPFVAGIAKMDAGYFMRDECAGWLLVDEYPFFGGVFPWSL